MIDPKQVNITQLLNQVPKKFCDGAIGGHNKDSFSFGLTSGNSVDAYATTPQIMKSISIWLGKQIEDYEKTFGVIDMTPPQIQSPIQMADLKESRDDDK